MLARPAPSSRAPRILLAAAATLLVAPAIAVGCGSTATRADSASTGTGGATVKATGTGGAASATTGSSSQTASSSSTGGAGSGGLGGAAGSGGSAVDAGDAGLPITTILDAGGTPLPGETTCQVVEVTDIPEPDFNHLTPCTPVTYATNPPSGGNHWPIWAAYKIYSEVVPREMYVHDLEHGAIVLTYRCAGACPDVVAALTQVFDSITDPECLTLMGPPARMVLTPDPLLATPIAASAWGATYTATCIDLPSLQAFAIAHYDHGREDFCTDGQDIESMPLCADAGDGG